MEKKMSKVDIMMQSIELRKAGKEAEAHELLRKKVPLEPWEFVYLKKCFVAFKWSSKLVSTCH